MFVVRSDLASVLNCLQRFSADSTGRQRGTQIFKCYGLNIDRKIIDEITLDNHNLKDTCVYKLYVICFDRYTCQNKKSLPKKRDEEIYKYFF